MRVVSDTSPLSNLAIIDRLDLLVRRYRFIHIPPAVREELLALSHPAGRRRIETGLTERWLIVIETPALAPLPFALDAGETAAIQLAQQLNANRLLMDERRGREAARRLGIPVSGILGELVYAKQTGHVTSVSAEVERLRREAGFFVDKAIEQFVLAEVGE